MINPPDKDKKVSFGNSRKKRKKHRKCEMSPTDTKVALLCFDTETTNHGELLELSVFGLSGNELYHSYFKPRAKKWPTEIHHILPEMVEDAPRFSSQRSDVQKLLCSTPFLLGCALSNDLHTMKRYGLQLRKKQVVIDIQNWFWLLNDTTDRVEKHQTGLAAIAEHYGLGFGNEHAHSATADTRLTLECFKKMVHHFNEKYPTDEPLLLSKENDPATDIKALKNLLKRFSATYQRAMQEFRMKNLAGFINVMIREQGYSFKYTRFEQKDNQGILFSVPVVDRVQAEKDMRSIFQPLQLKGFTGIYKFGENEFDIIRNYKNSIDIETFIEREKQEREVRQNDIHTSSIGRATKREATLAMRTATKMQK